MFLFAHFMDKKIVWAHILEALALMEFAAIIFFVLLLRSLSLPGLKSVKSQLWLKFMISRRIWDTWIIAQLNSFWYTWRVYYIFCVLSLLQFHFLWLFSHNPISQSLFVSIIFRTPVGVSASTCTHKCRLGRMQRLGIFNPISYRILFLRK